jgi:hypothetical protein
VLLQALLSKARQLLLDHPIKCAHGVVSFAPIHFTIQLVRFMLICPINITRNFFYAKNINIVDRSPRLGIIYNYTLNKRNCMVKIAIFFQQGGLKTPNSQIIFYGIVRKRLCTQNLLMT